MQHAVTWQVGALQASQTPVRVTIVNRSYKAGRHLLNAGEVQARILQKWAHSVVQVVDLQGLDLHHQIALFQQTSILIWTHGAAMADLLFLPQVQQASNLAAKHVILETGSSISIPCASLSACRASSCCFADFDLHVQVAWTRLTDVSHLHYHTEVSDTQYEHSQTCFCILRLDCSAVSHLS